MKNQIVLIAFVLTLNPFFLKSQVSIDAVDYSIKRGYYTDSVQLELSSKTPDISIHYTLDGSIPTLFNGQHYTAPIIIKSNSTVRASAYAPNYEDSKIKTHTYIFPLQVIRQKNNMLEDYGYDYSSEETGKVFWTEEMDSEIVETEAYKDEIIQGLLDIPTLSIVMPKEDLWGENGIYWGDNLEERGDEFERGCSIEMIYPEDYKGDTLKSWQENCGIKIQGGGARWDKGTGQGKQSFTLVFKKKFGAGKLKNEFFADAPHGKESLCGRYDKIILRAGLNKGWGCFWDREKTVYTRDQMGRDLQILMSEFGSHGTFIHLYLNGKYWGVYNACERPDHNFLANHLGGESEDYFYAKAKENGASDDRDGEPGQSRVRFFDATSKDYSKMPFQEMQNWVMVDRSIASYIVHGYANPGDGPQYYYGNCNNPLGPVVWIPWDLEDSFDGGSKRTGPPSVENMLDSVKSGDNGFMAFWKNIDFRMRFNDLIYRHFYNDGVMTDKNVIATWDKLTNYIYKAIVCESARWGDEKEEGGLMERDIEWDAARLAVRNDLQGRGDYFISELKSQGYFSALPAPKFIITGEEVDTSVVPIPINSELIIYREGTMGTVYFTIDGSDPRTWDLQASISVNAISANGIKILEPTTIKARTKDGNEWSPLHEILLVPLESEITIIIKPDEAAISTDNKVNKVEKLCIYPNPCTDKLFLTKNCDYKVYSMMGLELIRGNGNEIPMKKLPPGLYLVQINNNSYNVLKSD